MTSVRSAGQPVRRLRNISAWSNPPERSGGDRRDGLRVAQYVSYFGGAVDHLDRHHHRPETGEREVADRELGPVRSCTETRSPGRAPSRSSVAARR
jgi:hypothetical protein